MSTDHDSPAPARRTGRTARRIALLSAAATVATIVAASPALALPPNPNGPPVGTIVKKWVGSVYCAAFEVTADGTLRYIGIVKC